MGLVSISAQINGQPLGLPVTLRVLPAPLHSLELASLKIPEPSQVRPPPHAECLGVLHMLHWQLQKHRNCRRKQWRLSLRFHASEPGVRGSSLPSRLPRPVSSCHISGTPTCLQHCWEAMEASRKFVPSSHQCTWCCVNVIPGEPAFVAVRARDEFLNPILSGGAKLSAKLQRWGGAGEEARAQETAAEIRDRGTGIYEIDCALKSACDWEVRSPTCLPCHGYGPRDRPRSECSFLPRCLKPGAVLDTRACAHTCCSKACDSSRTYESSRMRQGVTALGSRGLLGVPISRRELFCLCRLRHCMAAGVGASGGEAGDEGDVRGGVLPGGDLPRQVRAARAARQRARSPAGQPRHLALRPVWQPDHLIAGRGAVSGNRHWPRGAENQGPGKGRWQRPDQARPSQFLILV